MVRKFPQVAILTAWLLTLAFSLAACGIGSKKPVDVRITLTEFQIDASLTEFEVGTPYHFIVTNQGTVEHEIKILPPMTGSPTPKEVQEAALAGIPKEQLPAGETASFDYTFTQEYPAGELELACHIPGHHETGMHTPIVVSP